MGTQMPWECVSKHSACSTHAVYYKTLKHTLGIEAVGDHAFMATIYYMYLVVKSMLDDICEVAKQEIKEDDLGSWKHAITAADGTCQTRGWHNKNATFTKRGSPVLSPHLPERQ